MTTIDASIPLGVRPFQVEQPVNQLAKLMQVQGMQQQNQLGQMQMEEMRRGIEDQNALRSALSAPDADPYKVLLQRGKIKEATEFQQGNAKAAHEKAQTEKAQLETARGKVALIGQLAGSVTDQASLERALLIARANGLDTSNVPSVYDPAAIQQVRNYAMTVEQQLEQVWKQKGYDLDVKKFGETVRHNTTTEGETGRHNRSTEGLTARGQNMADARAKEANAQGKTQIVETPQGFVIVDKNTGASRPAIGADGQPLKGKANDRVMTDAQAKANLFGSRMQESDRILADLEEKGVKNPGLIKGAVQGTVGLVPFMGDKLSEAAGAGINTLPSALGGPNSSQQMVEQARRDFLNAVLRRESGAVISPQEFSNAEKQYFPQPGDSKEVLAQKQRNRKLAIAGMEAEVPGGFRGVKTTPEKPASTGGATGEWGGGAGKVVDFGSLR